MNREELTKSQRWAIADALANERLPAINASLADVAVVDSFYTRYGKRALDILLSGTACIITLPLNVIIGIATVADVGRPVFFEQQRAGKNGKPFKMVKFRNMRNTRDARGDLLPSEMRVTKFGRFVRRTSLDELLNFWIVLKGDMSIIGPRPLVPEYTHRFNKRHVMRLSVKPGLECPPREIGDHVWTWQEQLDNDIWYVENLSFRTDLKMFANLIRFAFDRKSSKARASSKRGIFMGYSEDGIAITLQDVPPEYAAFAKESAEAATNA